MQHTFFVCHTATPPPLPHSPPPSPPQPHKLYSILYLASQYKLPPFTDVSGHCLSTFIPILLKSTSTSTFYLLRGIVVFLFLLL